MRGDLREGDCADVIRHFTVDQVLSAGATLADVIHVLTRHDSCFVTALGQVAGVIRRDDINKPMVRMWLFGLLTMIEMMLVQLIRQYYPGDSWQSRVSQARLERAKAFQAERQRRNQHCTLIDCLQFSDKGRILVEHDQAMARLGFESKRAAKRAVKELESLRNNLAHAQDIPVLVDGAQAVGIPADCCSADKLAIGAIHRGLYPKPVCSVGINTPCDAQVLSTQVMAELSEAPFFAIDVPYYHEEDTILHVAGQLKELIPFLEENTGRKMDYDRLREACNLSNQMAENLWEWLDWRKQVPLTQSSKLVGFTLLMQILFTGSQKGVDVTEGLLREARERTQRDERFFEERVRAIWYQDAVWTDLQIYDWFERELGLTVPVDIFGFYANEGVIDTSTPDTMIYGLARKLVQDGLLNDVQAQQAYEAATKNKTTFISHLVENKIVDSRSIAQSARGHKDGLWTTVVAAGVFCG